MNWLASEYNSACWNIICDESYDIESNGNSFLKLTKIKSIVQHWAYPKYGDKFDN